MKIGLSTSVIQRGRSGVGQYVLALVRALLPAAARHDFTLYVLEDDLPLFSFAAGAMRIQQVAERHRPPVKNILWHQTTLPELARNAGLDVLHVPSYRRMLWRRPCGLVATIHDLAPFHLAAKYDWARMFYGRVVARRLALRQDEIVAVSRLTARDIQAYFQVPVQRISVIPNGLDHERFRPGPQKPAQDVTSLPVGITAPFFLYVARLEHPAKNHVRLIEAFNRFKASSGSPWQLVLGGSDWHGASVIHDQIRASPFAKDIHRLGFVAPEKLPDWYRAADAFVFPSLFEGFGLPPVEAMACGCPVLSSRRGALAETVGAAAGSLDPENTGQMESALALVATNARWRAQLGATGLQHARLFDWRATAEATLEIYARAGARRKNSAKPASKEGADLQTRAGEPLLGRTADRAYHHHHQEAS